MFSKSISQGSSPWGDATMINNELIEGVEVEELFEIPEEFKDSFLDTTIPIPLKEEDFWAATDFSDNL